MSRPQSPPGSEPAAHPQRRKLPHDVPVWVAAEAAWFVTINCRPRGKPQLVMPESGDVVSRAVLDAARHYHERAQPKWFVHCLLLMPDHLHAILSFHRDATLRRTIAAWKGYVTRHHGICWQSGFFDHRLRNEDQFYEKLRYVRFNPVRQHLCATPEAWPHVLAFDARSGADISQKHHATQ